MKNVVLFLVLALCATQINHQWWRLAAVQTIGVLISITSFRDGVDLTKKIYKSYFPDIP